MGRAMACFCFASLGCAAASMREESFDFSEGCLEDDDRGMGAADCEGAGVARQATRDKPDVTRDESVACDWVVRAALRSEAAGMFRE